MLVLLPYPLMGSRGSWAFRGKTPTPWRLLRALSRGGCLGNPAAAEGVALLWEGGPPSWGGCWPSWGGWPSGGIPLLWPGGVLLLDSPLEILVG